MERVYDELQRLGFSKYESQAYVALLRTPPITGYEISKRSGVPRSMIYEVLSKLSDRGAVYTIPSEPVKYAPVPVKEVVGRLRRNLNETLSYVEDTLSHLERPADVNVIWHIRGSEPVLNEIDGLIAQAEQECWLSVWEPQAAELRGQMQAAAARGVKVFSMQFGHHDTTAGAVFFHNYMPPEVVRQRMGGQLTIAVRDGKEVVIANFIDASSSWAVKTADPALVLVAMEYIRHDIMIEEITREYGADKLDRLWRNSPELTHVVTGRLKQD